MYSTFLCWDTHSGRLIGQIRLPDIGEIALLDEARVAIATGASDKVNGEEESDHDRSSLLLWNARAGEIAHITQLPAHVGNLAISPNCEFLAAYMPTIATIQVWQTADWHPIKAFELEVGALSRDPGVKLDMAIDCYDLPRKRKFAPRGFDFEPDRFEFLDDNVLMINFSTRVVEVDIRPSSVGYAALLGNLKDFPRITHVHNEQREITVQSIEYDSLSAEGESRVQLYYWVPQGDSLPHDVTVKRRFCGTVRKPKIVDEACILASVYYNTPYYKRRMGLVNVISGRIVMLGDQGRLASGDNQLDACISPRGDMVAYWTFPDNKGIPRLSLQHIDISFLRAKGVSLEDELERSRKRHVEGDEAYMRLREEEGHLLAKRQGR